MNNSNKIILNTAISYFALIIKMIVGLFTVRFVLQALGEVDYGVYIIVGGIIAMLDVLNSNMTNTSMRYLAYSLGSANQEDIKATFNTTIFLHYAIGIITILILEVGGFSMFEYVVNIPIGRLVDAKIIFQFMIVSTFITVISVPYDAITNAHEKIWVLSVFDIVSVVLYLLLALFLLVYSGDRLIMYGLSLMLIQLTMRIFKVAYAKRSFTECRRIRLGYADKTKMKEILSFTGWNLFGSLAALGTTQLRSLVLNRFFGVRLNAAEGVTQQVSSPLNMIVTSMTRAINPQIMKSEGGNNHERMKYIVEVGAKYSSFLFALFGIPVLIELPYILNIWLYKVPEFAIEFCQLSIIIMLMEKFTFQIVHAISAVGNIRGFQITGALVSLLYLPIAWLLFKVDYPPVTIYILTLLSTLLTAIVRFYYGKKVAGINPVLYIKTAIIPVLLPLLLSTFLSVFVYLLLNEGIISLIAVFLLFCCSFLSLFWLIGMNKEEQTRWKVLVEQLKRSIIRKNK